MNHGLRSIRQVFHECSKTQKASINSCILTVCLSYVFEISERNVLQKEKFHSLFLLERKVLSSFSFQESCNHFVVACSVPQFNIFISILLISLLFSIIFSTPFLLLPQVIYETNNLHSLRYLLDDSQGILRFSFHQDFSDHVLFPSILQ